MTFKRRIKEISREANPPRVNHGQLAEDYDGIGQYVLVAMSRSSTAAAVKARLAVGDYGTGQVIPKGTPITMVVYRGRVEIISLGAK